MKTKYIKEINETIAEAFGWKSEPPTDYWNDLNSCREMENSISPEQKADYITTLEALCFKGDQSLETYWSVFHSTAPQRCEAFLRALSSWKEEWIL